MDNHTLYGPPATTLENCEEDPAAGWIATVLRVRFLYATDVKPASLSIPHS